MKSSGNNSYKPHPAPAWLRPFTLFISIGAVASLCYTFYVLAVGGIPSSSDIRGIDTLIILNLFFISTLTAVLFYRILRLRNTIKRGGEISTLQRRVTRRFFLVAFLPAFIVSIFSGIFFTYGIKSWFDEKVSTALQSSYEVAEAYMTEHVDLLRQDATAMAGDLNNNIYDAFNNPQFFNRLVNGQAALRSLTEAVVVHNNHIIAQSELSFSLALDKMPSDALIKAKSGEVAIITSEHSDRVRAMIAIPALPDTYLIVGRFVDAKVLDYLESSQGAVTEYLNLKKRISSIQQRVLLLFSLFSLLMVLLAAHYGFKYSVQLIGPITRLIEAANKVSAGDLSSRVEVSSRNDEIASLSRSFNLMTEQLEKQRKDLMGYNRLIEERRYFIETVLASISSGVIVVDANQSIKLLNRQARSILGFMEEDIEEKLLQEIVPEFISLLGAASATTEVSMKRDGKNYILLARVSPDADGAVITFDDITSLVSAKRSAAWADIARRVAHEIKNPLTPIQLSTERLRRKFSPDNADEKEVFEKYLETITRNLRDIGRIVEEFVGFARLPAPKFQIFDLAEITRKIIFSQEPAHATVKFILTSSIDKILVSGDEGHIGRVLVNLLKNAAEALEGANIENPEIKIKLVANSTRCFVEIQDNGHGFPEDILPRLTEPYVTTKEKGTGLGLAIVKKIIEEHGGELKLSNTKPCGALAEFSVALA